MLIYMVDVPRFDPDEAGPAYIYARVADHIEARIKAASSRQEPGCRVSVT